MQLRSRAYASVMAAGRSPWGKLWLRCKLICADLAAWLLMCMMAIREKLSTWSIY